MKTNKRNNRKSMNTNAQLKKNRNIRSRNCIIEERRRNQRQTKNFLNKTITPIAFYKILLLTKKNRSPNLRAKKQQKKN